MFINGEPFEPGKTRRGSARGSHRLSLPLSCDRLPYFRHFLNLSGQRKYASEARVGTAFHVLRLRQLARQLDVPPRWALRNPRLEAKRQCRPDRLKKSEWDNAKSMYRADRKKAFGKKGWKLLDLEIEVYATLDQILTGLPRRLQKEVVTSRLDSVFESKLGLEIVDIKGEYNDWVSRDLREFDPDVPKWLAHWQCCVNQVVAEAYYGRPVHAWYAYRISRQNPYTSALCKVVPAPDLLVQTPKLLGRAVAEEQRILAEAVDDLGTPLPTGMASGHCSSYGGCEFLPLCSAENEEIFDNLVENDFVQLERREGA